MKGRVLAKIGMSGIWRRGTPGDWALPATATAPAQTADGHALGAPGT
ncbi:MAG: hypothetical protein FWG74_09475 [Planctomycetes bacterium]|nr:hypothetical protein [Planctomycetota bacterium]